MVDLLRAFGAVEKARRLTALEASEALWRGSRSLFTRAGIGSALALAEEVAKRRRQGIKV
jgi:hypothetical protein